jgi:hypothetical protein
MTNKQWSLTAVLLLTVWTAGYGQTQTSLPPETPPPTDIKLLTNNDVLRMVEGGVKSGVIISKILTSSCNFDLFPPVLRDLRRRRVPDTVLMAMKMAPNGPPALGGIESKTKAFTAPVQIPEGTIVEVETAQAVSSANVATGTAITFLVARRVFVNNVLAIDRGAIAKAHIVKTIPAGVWGRAGMLAWAMDYVVAVDGTRIPIKVTGRQKGKNRAFAIAGGAVATGALIFPYSSPVALIWGLKKGDEAILRGSKVFSAIVRTTTEVAGLRPRPGGAIYHDRDTVNASAAPPTSTSFERGSFRPQGFRPNR